MNGYLKTNGPPHTSGPESLLWLVLPPSLESEQKLRWMGFLVEGSGAGVSPQSLPNVACVS